MYRRLFLKDIESSSEESATLESLHEGIFIDQTPARDIDKSRSLLEHGQAFGIDDPSIKVQDVIHLDKVDFEHENGYAGNRIADEKKLLKKLDLRMMPIMMLICMYVLLNVLNYLDRSNIAVARLSSFERDLGLHGTQYNTIISIFFVGYILTQVSTNMILDKVKPSVFLPAIMCCWVVVSACSGAVQNYEGMIRLRFCLGFVEAPFFPGSLFLFSSWYTKKELAKRISILYAAGQMAGAFGELLGSAIMGGMDGKAGLAAWRWLWTATIPIAFAAAFILPNYPDTTKWLTEQEKHLAILRIVEDANEQDIHKSGSREGLKLALTDPSLYILWFMQLSLNNAATFTNFFPTIVKTLGYNKTRTLLLSAPPYVFAAILGITNSWQSDKTRERWLHVIWPQVFCSIGFIISAVTLNVAARYTATFMMMFVYVSFGCILSWVSSTSPRPSSKRAVAYAIVNAGSNLASIYASYIYPSSQGPRYWQANVVNVAFSAACIALATALRFYLGWRNKKLEQAIIDDEIIEGSVGSAGDCTGRSMAMSPRLQIYTEDNKMITDM